MILVDSSIWIDYFHDRQTLETSMLHSRLGAEPIGTGDLIVAEVLQGMRTDRLFTLAQELFESMDCVAMVDRGAAIEAARNYRRLRALGVTPRKTIDTLIATRCILNDIPLLYSDRDFDPFVTHLGLRSAMNELPGVN